MIIKRLSWDDECRIDLLTEKGFVIKERAFQKKKKQKNQDKDKDEKETRKDEKKVKSKTGIHSPKFGSDWGDDDAFEERYSCKCGHLKGGGHKGEECDVCGTVVVYVDIDLSYTGWIPFYKYKIIQPLFFKQLMTALSERTFLEIIGIEKKINGDGFVEEPGVVIKGNPFYALGMIQFYKRFHEVMAYFLKKTRDKDKQDLIIYLATNKDKVFSSYIPVYSALLRPISFGEDIQYTTPVDKRYMSIVSKSITLKKKIDEERDSRSKNKEENKKRHEYQCNIILYEAQKKLNNLWELVFEQIDGKNGHIKGEILGGRINYTSRNVIIPDPTLKADEVIFNYHTFAELFKNQLIHALVDINGISYNDAFEQWTRGIIYDNSLLGLMKFIIKRDKPRVFINRNPTINYGSFDVMHVIDVTGDLDNYTLSMPVQVLAEYNADFDGDILNIGLFVTEDLADAYEKVFNPRKNMYVDRNDGLFNDGMGLHKDQIIGLSQFCNL